MRRCFVGEAHDMLSTFDDIFGTLVLFRWWVLLSVRHTGNDGQQEKKRYRAHDLKSFLPTGCRSTGNNSTGCSWWHALEQPCDLTGFCPPHSLVPLLRQSIPFGEQCDLHLVYLVVLYAVR